MIKRKHLKCTNLKVGNFYLKLWQNCEHLKRKQWNTTYVIKPFNKGLHVNYPNCNSSKIKIEFNPTFPMNEHLCNLIPK